MVIRSEVIRCQKKILIVNDEMVVGGVARVLNNLLIALKESTDYEIDLLVLHKHGEMLSGIPKGIKVIEGTPFFSVIDLPLGQLIKSKKIGLLLRKLYLVTLMKTGLIGQKIKKNEEKCNSLFMILKLPLRKDFVQFSLQMG